MNTNLSKFDLIASMMKRLDVSPSALTMNWLQEQVLSFACLARSSHQDEPEQRLVGTFVSLELLPAAAGHAVSLPREEEVASSSAEVQVPQIFGSQNKEAEQKLSADDSSGKNVFNSLSFAVFNACFDDVYGNAFFAIFGHNGQTFKFGIFAVLEYPHDADGFVGVVKRQHVSAVA